MGNGASTPEFSRKKSKKEYAFIKLGLRCNSCNVKHPCYWPGTFGYRWMSVDEEYMHANPEIFAAQIMGIGSPYITKRGQVIGRFELHGRFCLLNDAGTSTLDSYSKLADLVQRERPTDKTCVKELRSFMEELTKANVKVNLVKEGI